MVATASPVPVPEAASRFAARREPLERFLRECGAARDLLRSNPVLAFALANCDQFRRHAPLGALRHAAHLVARKQREILGWLGFPSTESTVSTFPADIASVP